MKAAEQYNNSPWSAVLSMCLCVAMLIASEFMPVSLLTPIAQGLGATVGQTGEAISISGLFAMGAALLMPTAIGKVNRKKVLVVLVAFMMLSLLGIAMAPNFRVLMIARALLGICIGGFWSLATSILMRLVEPEQVPRALGVMYLGQALASAFAAPIGSYLGGIIGWRGVFWVLLPIVAINLVWHLMALPSLPSDQRVPVRVLWQLPMRPWFRRALVSMALSFAGAFTMFTYLRPYLEQWYGMHDTQLALCFLLVGAAGFIGSPLGSRMVQNHLLRLLKMLPLVMALATLILLVGQANLWLLGVALLLWGAMNTALSVGWMSWMSRNVKDQPEAAGSLMVATVQGSILMGSALGGELLNGYGVVGTFSCSVVLLLLALAVMGSGKRLLNPEVSR